MADATVRIAQEYATSQNLDVAREQLAELDVANVNQWLLYVTETHMAEGGDAQGAQALSELASALGLNLTSVAVSPAEGESANTAPEAVEQSPAAEEAEPVVVVGDLAGSDDGNDTAGNDTGETAATDSAADSANPPVIEIAPVESSEESVTDGDNAASDNAASDEESSEAAAQAATVTATNGMNVRGGPGLTYNIVGAMQTGETAQIVGKNPQGDWWQVTLSTGQQGWVYSPLVTTAGDTASVAVASNIPEPPPAAPAAAPVEAAPAAEEVVEAAPEVAPAEEAPAEEAPVEEAAPPPSGTDFVLIERRLWGPEENGGRMDGTSVVCGEKRQLQVHVLDAAGNPINGVAVQAVYGAQEIEVTGAQGKGDGLAEFILGDGQDVKVIKDVDGREVSSDVATNLSTKPYAIDFNDLIQAGYCTDAASCQKNVVDVYACGGHYSWTVKFQRSY